MLDRQRHKGVGVGARDAILAERRADTGVDRRNDVLRRSHAGFAQVCGRHTVDHGDQGLCQQGIGDNATFKRFGISGTEAVRAITRVNECQRLVRALAALDISDVRCHIFDERNPVPLRARLGRLCVCIRRQHARQRCRQQNRKNFHSDHRFRFDAPAAELPNVRCYGYEKPSIANAMILYSG